MTSEKRPHHHGNLRKALIDAGIALLIDGGPAALSLRKCAAKAGVSHAAPAHHFKGLGSLELAIVTRAHTLLTAAMIAERDQAAPTPHARLQAICAGYIRFAREHTALFEFIFLPRELQPELFDSQTWQEFLTHSIASYNILQEACAPFEQGTETAVWSLVHGYAMLFGNDTRTTPQEKHIPAFAEVLSLLRLT